MKFQLANGKTIPAIGYGVFRMENDQETIDCIIDAINVGYTHIDTAKVYNNEEAVGKAIKQCGLPREDLFITTKLFNDDMRADNAVGAFEESLKKLDLDYVDLYITHWPVKDKYIESYLELEKLYNAGKIKAIGVSNCHIHHLEDLAKKASITPMVNQIEVQPYLDNEELVSYCKEKNIIVEAWSPLCANKNDLLKEEILINIGKKYKKSPAQVVLRWNIERGIIPLPKSSRLSRIKENFEIFDFQLTKTEMILISSLNKDERCGSDPDNFNF